MKEVEKIINSWKHTDKYPCPNCVKPLKPPQYTCVDCGIILKLKMVF